MANEPRERRVTPREAAGIVLTILAVLLVLRPTTSLSADGWLSGDDDTDDRPAEPNRSEREVAVDQ